jgi:hypothetical protein
MCRSAGDDRDVVVPAIEVRPGQLGQGVDLVQRA